MGRRKKGDERRIARGRIGRLLDQAHAEAGGPDDDLADRHAGLARRVAMRYQVQDPRLRLQVCRTCGAYRAASSSGRVRIRAGRMTTTCLRCGRIDRRPIGAHHDPE